MGRTILAVAALVAGFGIAAITTAPAHAAPANSALTARTLTAEALAAAGALTAGTAPVGRLANEPDPGTEKVSCRATVTIVAQWSTGFLGQVTVANTSDVPIRWRVTINFPGGTITPPPDYIVIQDGANWLIYPPPASWAGVLPVGASTVFGFTGTVTGPIGGLTASCTASPA